VSVLSAAATNPLENYSDDTIELVRDWFREWDEAARRWDRTQERCQELAARFCPAAYTHCVAARKQACLATFKAATPVPHPKLYRVHVRFDAIGDPDVKRRLQNVDTRLRLEREEVDKLVDWGGKLLREAPDYRELVGELGGTP
jgi:hypothetical protein